MAAPRRLQREWKQLQLSTPANLVLFKQYKLQYEQALVDHPGWDTQLDQYGTPLSLSLDDSIASVFPHVDLIAFPTNLGLSAWTAYINGARDTVYDSFRFELRMIIPTNYPYQPPIIKFLTPILHPNIDFNTGEICLDTLKENWTPTWTLESTLRAIQVLLGAPETTSPLNLDSANIMRRGDNRGFWSIARLQTIKYAIPLPQRQQEFVSEVLGAALGEHTQQQDKLLVEPSLHLESVEIPSSPLLVDPEQAPTQPGPDALYSHFDTIDH